MIKIFKIIELADKYNLNVENDKFNSRIDMMLSCGLLAARVAYTNFDDSVTYIEMPEKYITGYPNDKGHRYIHCKGFMQPQNLFAFERKLKFLLKNYKKCEVERRKLELENDFK